jgi:hypothetical protein|tara:strand:- start:1066 stop:2001 length:936 start_codon:yes stop_codon:yes gene_type:complete
MTQAFPVKAIVQPGSGDVVLGEFLESDYVGIFDGGTGAGGDAVENGLPESATDAEILAVIKENVRQNFNIPRFDTFVDYATLNAQNPATGRFAQDNSTNTFYYGTGEAWIPVGTALVVQGSISAELEFGGDIVSNFDPTTLITSVSVNLSPLQSEINSIETGAGLASNGTYIQETTTNYINNATSLKNADSLLDTAIFAERTRALGVEGTIISDINIIENDIQNFEYTGHTSAQVSGGGVVGMKYDSTTGKYAPSSDFGVGGFIKFTKSNGNRDDIPLTTTFTGNSMISGFVEFFKSDGSQDDIVLISNGV